jgi:hypothetical protein
MNVDWFTLLLLFIFFVLPMIQQVVAARRKTGESEQEQEEGELPMEVPESRPRARPRVERLPEPAPEARRGTSAGTGRNAEPARTQKSSDGWSDGWASWPSLPPTYDEEAARVEAPPPAPVFAPPPPESTRGWGAPAPIAPVNVPGPSSVPVRLVQVRAPVRREETRRIVPKVAPTRGTGVVVGTLTQEELRRAIVINEILGRPMALREGSQGSGPAG